NGAPQADQKAVVKSLIRLGLSPENASELAAVLGIDPDSLTIAAAKAKKGATLEPQDASILEKFDAALDAVLDGGFQRADQQYRNSAKAVAALVAVIMAVIGGAMAHTADGTFQLLEYVFSQDFLLAL